jgi:hypothetical protein
MAARLRLQNATQARCELCRASGWHFASASWQTEQQVSFSVMIDALCGSWSLYVG